MTEDFRGLDRSQAPKWGTKDWANYLLREGIRALQEWDREPGSRVLEVLCKIEILQEQGFWWQARVLRSWLHKYWNDLRPEETSSRDFQTSSARVQASRQLPVSRPQGRPTDQGEGGASK